MDIEDGGPEAASDPVPGDRIAAVAPDGERNPGLGPARGGTEPHPHGATSTSTTPAELRQGGPVADPPDQGSGGQLVTSPASTSLDHRPTGPRGHAMPEAVALGPPPIVGLEGPLHGGVSSSGCRPEARGGGRGVPQVRARCSASADAPMPADQPRAGAVDLASHGAERIATPAVRPVHGPDGGGSLLAASARGPGGFEPARWR